MTHFCLLTLSLVLCSLNQAASEVYYITTTSTVKSCLTLSQFAANPSKYLNSNTTLVFLSGTHYLSIVNLTLSNMDSFVMKSENLKAEIKCTSYSHIHFSHSQYIHITNMKFLGCGGNQVKKVEEFVLQDTTFKGQENSATALELIETTAQIINSTFVTNRKGSYRKSHEPNVVFDLFIGGAIIATNSVVDISQSKLEQNGADIGGVIFAENSIINMSGNNFINNSAINRGGVLYSYSSTITIETSEFYNNNAIYWGGVLYSYSSNTTIQASVFHNNSATSGGVLLYSDISNTTIQASVFHNNSATDGGGVLYSYGSNTKIESSNFTENSSPIGSVINSMQGSKIQYHNYLLIANNSADRYAVIFLLDSEFSGLDSESIITFSSNLGSLMAFNSNITFIRNAVFVNNRPSQITAGDIQEGGAITLFQSNAFFDGVCNLKHNKAENGGAIHSTESKLYMNGNVTIAYNKATRNGGGVYLAYSELNCQLMSFLRLFKNTAEYNGGGLHAISSSIKANSEEFLGTEIHFTKNIAKKGGGLSLEANAKIYILKYNHIIEHYEYPTKFTANEADYGGAVYVDDNTNPGTCASDQITECFFQSLAIYDSGAVSEDTKTQSISFILNHASISGSTLYGGLLDRCAVSRFAEIYKMYQRYPHVYEDRLDGIVYFKKVSTDTSTLLVSSLPVQVCFCFNNEHKTNHCTHQSHVIVKKGETFTVSLVAVDQVGQPVNATIQTSLNYSGSGLAEGQLSKKIPAECTNLTFNVVSPRNSENLTLYASDGPCKDADLSRATIEIHFVPCKCLIGLQDSGSKTNCTCECFSDIRQYVEECDSHTGSFMKKSQSTAWISYINDTDLIGYLIYPNCPFDYCLSSSPAVDLNQPNGADAQCAFSRSSLLCGSCQPGLSLSLGSSRCLPCPSYWPALFVAITIAAILAGVALVTLLLVLNMTVVVGTLNGLIFYANVVYVNKRILLPFEKTNIITVFISWLNLELGIDTCYFPGMDSYIKTWLQLVFPAYIILLVVLVIIVSSYSSKFSNLIGKKNPVATLATLVLLSYAKLLEICFTSLSVGILKYPDGTSESLWLPDATIKYLSEKHILLFIAAVLILLVGLVYTALLFSWQCLLHLPRWRIFNWSRNPKVQTFIETHHTPFTPKHRYWTGLLLVARVVLYLVAAANVSNNPTVVLMVVNIMVWCIVLLKGFIISLLYRKWSNGVIETIFFLNILFFAIFTWYFLGDKHIHQEAVAYTSVIITIVVLLLIILYHVYTYTTVFSKFKKTKLGRMIDRLLTEANRKPNPRLCRLSPPPDDDIHRFDELLDDLDCPVYTDDYEAQPLLRPAQVKPTYSVVEVHHPHHPPPDPEQTNTQNVPVCRNWSH